MLLAQIREKELEKGEQRRLEISEYKEVCQKLLIRSCD